MIDFLEEYRKLQLKTPRPSAFIVNAVNSDFCYNVDQAKNLYLIANGVKDQDCLYGRDVYGCIDCVDCDHIKDCTLLYGCINCRNCYNGDFLQDSESCSDCRYGYFLKNCKNCVGCAGLSHREFYIFNEPYSPEEYRKKIASLSDPQIREGFERVKRQTPRANLTVINSEMSSGNGVYHSRNIYHSYDVINCEDSGYLIESKDLKDCYDCSILEKSQLCYQLSSSFGMNNSNFCYFCMESSDLEYCENVVASEFCFGCISLHRKKYYILNQPYSPEEYFRITAEIKADLRARNLYGKMLIPSTYPRSETVAAWDRM